MCQIDTIGMKGDDVLRNYLLYLLWVSSSLYRYLNQQPPVALNQEVERHKFMGERAKIDFYKKSEKFLMLCYQRHTADKVEGINSWILYTQVKKDPNT